MFISVSKLIVPCSINCSIPIVVNSFESEATGTDVVVVDIGSSSELSVYPLAKVILLSPTTTAPTPP